MNKERWLPVVGYEGLYEVSDFGRVKSLPRWRQYTGGSPRRVRGGLLSPGKTQKGYQTVHLHKGGVGKAYYVHYLVLSAFIGPRPEGAETRHFPDRDRQNNQLSNLSWGTAKQNQADRKVHGTDNGTIERKLLRGEDQPSAKLTTREVLYIRRVYKPGKGSVYNGPNLAKKLGVDPSLIYMVVKREIWNHVQ